MRPKAEFGIVMDKKLYDEVKKKYSGLPDFDLLNEEFELFSIEKPDFLLRQVCRKIRDRIEELVVFLENIIQPSAETFVSFYECSCFSDAEKKEVLKSFKKLMILYRSLLHADFLQSDENFVDVIKVCFKEFPELRLESCKWLNVLKDHWHEFKETKEILNYLG